MRERETERESALVSFCSVGLKRESERQRGEREKKRENEREQKKKSKKCHQALVKRKNRIFRN